jgi:septum formation protein
MPQRQLFLASKSPRRAEILSKFNIPFHVIPNKLLEETLPLDKYTLRSSLKKLAKQKAIISKSNNNGLILGVDTIVVLKNQILEKPQNLEQAQQMLTQLSGNTHEVYSALCLYDTITNKSISRSSKSIVTFKNLTNKEIFDYCTKYQVLDKAGAYAIQDIGDCFVTSLIGSYYNVMGLPINTLLKLLKNYDIVWAVAKFSNI